MYQKTVQVWKFFFIFIINAEEMGRVSEGRKTTSGLYSGDSGVKKAMHGFVWYQLIVWHPHEIASDVLLLSEWKLDLDSLDMCS